MECRNPSILVLMAAVNEQAGIGPTLKDLKKHIPNSHIIVVDGYSTDKTANIATKLGAQIIYRECNGKGDALAHAIDNITDDYEYVVFIDADYTYPAQFIPHMLQTIQENPTVGMICGNRFNQNHPTVWKNSMFYRGNMILGYTHNMLNGVAMHDPLTGLRVVRWKIIRNWKPKSKGFDIEVELNHQVGKQGYNTIEIPIQYRKRLGEKKLKMKHGATILKRILFESLN